MSVSDFAPAQARHFLRELLITARKQGLPVTEAVRQITEGLEFEGMGRGFLPLDRVMVTDKLQSASVVFGFSNYSEQTISVS